MYRYNVCPEIVLILPHRSSSAKILDIMAETNQMNMPMGPWKVKSALCAVEFPNHNIKSKFNFIFPPGHNTISAIEFLIVIGQTVLIHFLQPHGSAKFIYSFRFILNIVLIP